MKRTIFTAIALASLLFAACGDKDKDKDTETPATDETAETAKPVEGQPATDTPAEPAGDSDAEELLQASVNMTQQLTAALTENKDDCAAAAQAIKDVVAEHQDLLQKGQEMGAADPNLAQKMAENEELKTAQAEWTQAMQANCAGDEAVMEALMTMAPKADAPADPAADKAADPAADKAADKAADEQN